MKMIRLEGMLLKKLFLILFLMSAAMVLILPLLIAYVPVDPQYLIAAAIFVLLLAAECSSAHCMSALISVWRASCRSMCAGISVFKAR